MTPPVSHANAFVWGRNVDGCLGLGDALFNRKLVRNPTKLNAGESDWTQIACGGWHTVALSPNGEVFIWGGGDYDGQLGDGDGKDTNVPTKVENLSRETIIKVACGTYHTAVVTSTGKLLTWYAMRRQMNTLIIRIKH